MGAYKVNTTGGHVGREFEAAESNDYGIAEKIARMLSADDMGHYWITTVTREPLTSFTGGQRDHQATAGN